MKSEELGFATLQSAWVAAVTLAAIVTFA